MKRFLQSKVGQISLLVFSVVLGAWTVTDFKGFVQERRTIMVFQSFARANDQRIQRGDTVDSIRSFVRDLENIDIDYTAPELKSALIDYIAGLNEGLALLEAGEDTSPADLKVSEAYARLAEISESQ